MPKGSKGGMSSSDFSQLFGEHAGFVWRVLQRHGVPARDLEDACQEVFIVVFRRLGDFEGRSSLRTWLYGIAVRVAIGIRRRAYFRREVLSAAPCEAEVSGALDPSTHMEARALLTAALLALPRPKREVFVLYELEGMTMAEIATALNVPENTALYRLYGARKEVQAFVRKTAARTRRRAERGEAPEVSALKPLRKRVAP